MEKQQSVFFMLSVPEEKIKDGLVIRCTSANKSRFKLVVSSGLLEQTPEIPVGGIVPAPCFSSYFRALVDCLMIYPWDVHCDEISLSRSRVAVP